MNEIQIVKWSPPTEEPKPSKYADSINLVFELLTDIEQEVINIRKALWDAKDFSAKDISVTCDALKDAHAELKATLIFLK